MKKSGFIEGAFIATLAIFFTKFIGIVYVVPFYSIVGDKGGALYGYAYNIYNLFLIISSAGIPLAISKLTSELNALNKTKEKDYMFKAVKKIILCFSTISFLICFIFAPIIAKLIIGDVTGGNTIEDIAYVIRCVSFAILVVPLLSISRGYLQGHGYISPSSTSQVIEQLVRVGVILGGSFLTLKILNLSLRTAIGVAVFGACAGAIAAYLYLISKMKIVSNIKNDQKNELDSSAKKDIIKKVILYAIPFIVINVAFSLYNSTDMILLIRGLHNINYNASDIETISSVFTTWGHKLNTIVTSIAAGIAISLVPSMARSNATNDYEGINDKMNKTIQIFLYVALPLAVFMSIFSTQIWTIFYGKSYYGPIIFRYSILTAALDALFIMICNGLQGLNKSKLIYLSAGLGLMTNVLLDIPLIYLFNNLGIYPFYGAITSTVIGYAISISIPLFVIKNKYKLDYSNTLNKIPKLLCSYLLLIIVSLLYSGIIKNVTTRILLIILLIIIGFILLIIYYFINKKEIEDILGKKLKDLIKKKEE